MKLYFYALVLSIPFLLLQDPFETVAITLSPDTPAIVISRVQAEAEFKQLCKDSTDDPRLKALAAALNPMPDWPQFVMNNEPGVCNRDPKPIVPVAEPEGREKMLKEMRRWRIPPAQASGRP